MILSIDLGTSVTKVGIWDRKGLVSMGRANVSTSYGPDGRAEQDPMAWWGSLKEAFASATSSALASSPIEVIGFSAARQTFVPVDSEMRTLGPGLLWSDRRAYAEAEALAERHGGIGELHQQTGVYLDSGAVVSKVAWLAAHEPSRLESARWLLCPRDLVVSKMTGRVATDFTLSSATGLYDDDGTLVYDLHDLHDLYDLPGDGGSRPPFSLQGLLPDVEQPSCVVGGLLEAPALELGLDPGIPVVIGAGDRQCEVLGAGASTVRPMVSWGTTANLSVPLDTRPEPIPEELILTRSATKGWLLEGGLSAAGSLLDWIGNVARTDVASLVNLARSRPPGANGVLVMPWLGGARAPWWRDACASAVGLRADTELGDLARAAIEGVAFDVGRCLEAACLVEGGARPEALALAGGSSIDVWVEVLTGVTGLPAVSRRYGEAASTGAALLAARAVGIDTDLEEMNPIASRADPDPRVVERYTEVRPIADQVAGSMISVRALRVSD